MISALFGFRYFTPPDYDGGSIYYFGGCGACSADSEDLKLKEGRERTENSPVSSSFSTSFGNSNSGSSFQ